MWLLPLVLGVATARVVPPPDVQTHTCPDGLTVLVVEDHALPLVTVEIGAHNGSLTEPPELNGLSHLYEHMFFKGNAVYATQGAFMTRAQQLGLTWNGTTNTELVNYFLTATTPNLAGLMHLMHDAIVAPRFDPQELERERVVVTGELDRNEATPSYALWHAIEKRVWWKYPSRKDPLGLRATVLAATVEQMKTIQERYYVPNNAVLVVTGDVTAADVFAQADALYADWKRAPDPFVAFPLVSHPPIAKTEVVLVEQPVRSVTGNLVWHGPSTVGPSVRDTYAADALGEALDEPTSRFRRATIDSGACTQAHLGWFTQANVGPITLSFTAAPDKVDACIAALRAELPRLGDVTQDALHRAAHQLEVGQVKERERSTDLAHSLSFWWATASLDYFRTYIDQLHRVTPADAQRYVATYITGKPFVAGIMVSPELAQHGLDRAHFEAQLGIR